jgi:hypothetical protein
MWSSSKAKKNKKNGGSTGSAGSSGSEAMAAKLFAELADPDDPDTINMEGACAFSLKCGSRNSSGTLTLQSQVPCALAPLPLTWTFPI